MVSNPMDRADDDIEGVAYNDPPVVDHNDYTRDDWKAEASQNKKTGEIFLTISTTDIDEDDPGEDGRARHRDYGHCFVEGEFTVNVPLAQARQIANLIAAAPALFRVLERIVATYEGNEKPSAPKWPGGLKFWLNRAKDELRYARGEAEFSDNVPF